MLSQAGSESNPYLTIKLSIVQERIRQARRSFDFALIATALYCVIKLHQFLLVQNVRQAEKIS